MRPKNYSERQNWRHQFRGQHEWNEARCKRVVVAVDNCTRAMCVRARRRQCSSTESARSPPQRLYKPGWLSIARRAGPAGMCSSSCDIFVVVMFTSDWNSTKSRVDVIQHKASRVVMYIIVTNTTSDWKASEWPLQPLQ